MRFRLKNKKKKRIKHNDLTHYFIRDHKDLPPAYLRSCEKFFKELSTKRQASSTKLQAAGNRPECFSTKKHLTIK